LSREKRADQGKKGTDVSAENKHRDKLRAISEIPFGRLELVELVPVGWGYSRILRTTSRSLMKEIRHMGQAHRGHSRGSTSYTFWMMEDKTGSRLYFFPKDRARGPVTWIGFTLANMCKWG